MITPKKIYWPVGCLVIIVILLYLGFQINAFAGSPVLFVDLPQDLTVEQETIIIKGQTSKDSKVLINNQELAVDDQGNFQEEVYLQMGLNILNLEAVNYRGKTTYIQKRILRK